MVATQPVWVNTHPPRQRCSSALCRSIVFSFFQGTVSKDLRPLIGISEHPQSPEFHIYSHKHRRKSVRHTEKGAGTMTRMGRRRGKKRIPSAEGDNELERRMNAISRAAAQRKEDHQSHRKQPLQHSARHDKRPPPSRNAKHHTAKRKR